MDFYNMKRTKETIIVVIIGVIITLMFIFIVGRMFMHEHKILLLSASSAFKEAVLTDNSIQIPDSTRYDSCRSLNSLSITEKMHFCDQVYITEHDSSRRSLDCVFHSLLVREHIAVLSAVSVLYKQKIQYSCKDTTFYQTASALPPVVYCFNDMPAGRIEIRGYLQLPFLMVLKQTNRLYLWTIYWILLLGFVIGGYILIRRQRYKRELKLKEEAMMKNHIPLIQNMEIEWTDLSNHVSFNREEGLLCCEGKNVVLTGNPLKLFCLLLDNSGRIVKYKDIVSRVIKRKITGDISKSDKDVVFATVKSLRNSLRDFPSIDIETFMGKGYKLEVKDEHHGDPSFDT